MTSNLSLPDLGITINDTLSSVFKSPAESTGLLLADKIQYLRWKSAVKTLEKVQKYVDKKGMKINEVPPLKFFLPWAEGCSLEKEKDENMQELWAKLLLNECVDSDPNAQIFVDILKKLQKEHADLLQGFLKSRSGRSPQTTFNYSVRNEVEDSVLNTLIDHDFPFHNDKSDDLISELHRKLQMPGLHIYHCSVYPKPIDIGVGVFTNKELGIDFNASKSGYNSSIGEALIALGLIEKFTLELFWGPQIGISEHEIKAFGYNLTSLGWGFVIACGLTSENTNDQ